ncbi:hypothetical protein J6590_101109 [Homalodisca vitripennis]|nr:hypothetical protein J6590_101109 [Homalodisca vitripennis]
MPTGWCWGGGGCKPIRGKLARAVPVTDSPCPPRSLPVLHVFFRRNSPLYLHPRDLVTPAVVYWVPACAPVPTSASSGYNRMLSFNSYPIHVPRPDRRGVCLPVE